MTISIEHTEDQWRVNHIRLALATATILTAGLLVADERANHTKTSVVETLREIGQKMDQAGLKHQKFLTDKEEAP